MIIVKRNIKLKFAEMIMIKRNYRAEGHRNDYN